MTVTGMIDRRAVARRTVRQFVSVSGANLVAPGLALLSAPVVARALDPAGRGAYGSITAAFVLIGILGTFGVQDGLSRFLAHAGWGPRRAARALLLTLLAGTPVTCALAIGYAVVLTGSTAERAVALGLVWLVPVQVALNLLAGVLVGAHDVGGQVFVRVAPAIVRFGLLVGVAAAGRLTVAAASLIVLAASAAGLAWPVLRRRGAVPPSAAEPPLDRAAYVELLRFSFSALPGLVAALAASRLDQTFGLVLIGAAQLGVYAVAVTVAEIPLILAGVARSLVLASAHGGERRTLIRLALGAVVVVSAALAAACPFVVPWAFGQAYAAAVLPCVILLAGTVVAAVNSVWTATLLARGRPVIQSVGLGAGAIANLVALVVLSPLGAVGASIASVVGYGCTTVVLASARRTVPDRARASAVAALERSRRGTAQHDER